MNNYAAIILARTDSKRFPNKAITNLKEKPLLEWCIDNLSASKVFRPIVATSDRKIDDPIIEIAERKNTDYFRGDADNVAKRVLDCCRFYNIEAFARINGDSPFIRKEFIESAFRLMKQGNYDFVTNLIPRAFPYGITAEILSTDLLKRSYAHFTNNKYTEHITTYFYEHADRLNICRIPYEHGNHQHVRLVVDTREDLERLEKLLSHITDFRKADLLKIVTLYNQYCN